MEGVYNSLKSDYKDGKFDRLKSDLVHFITEHPGMIRSRVDELGKDDALASLPPKELVSMAIKEIILDRWVIHPKEDAKAQMEEIERHLWIIGVNNNQPPDRNLEAARWIQSHAESWREYRLLAILFVFDKNLYHYLELLRETKEFEGFFEG